uniref:bifunctional folylpolyglutamate synthase/dihydrofolate synthase n=1 Tax=Treponema pedis TaxID=409322 RepID=UPI000685D831
MITTDEFTVWLEGFIDYGRNANKSIDNLKKMEKFARYFDNPQKEFKAIHIAGSKGKGSVSIMIASILSEAAVFAGLYTSPHVMDFRERISNSGIFFQDKEYSDAYEKIIAGFNEIIKKEPLIDPGWFEIVTMTAFLLFALQKTEWAVIETGLGGRLDMTNILNPEISVLTPIELEHCNYLGNTIEEIAFEKAGIIKHKTPVFCSRQEDEALKVFKKKAFETDSPFFYLPEIIKTPIAFSVSEKSLKINIEFNNENKIGKLFSRTINTELKLLDEVQAENAALAACTVKYLFPQIKEDIIERGLSKAWLPARFEILSKIPPVIIDGAHTKNSIALCIKTYSKLKLIDKQG